MLFIKPEEGSKAALDEEYEEWIDEKANEISSIYYDGIRQMVSYLDAQNFTNEEYMAVWLKLNSKVRTAYKEHKNPKEKKDGT
jgi:hypothetical protein